MRVAILGGCGFIGSHVADLLVSKSCEVLIFDRPEADRKNIRHLSGKVIVQVGDFCNSEDIGRAVAGAEVVVHFVSTSIPLSAFNEPGLDVEQNVIGTIGLLRECVKHKVRKVVFSSSGGTIYGIPQQLPIKESHPLNPITPYGISKLAIEKFLGLYSYHHGLDYAALRLSNPYGGRQVAGSGQGVIASWLQRLSEGNPVEIWGDGAVVRDYLYIWDAVNAISAAIFTDSPVKVFNVGSGQGYSLQQLHQELEMALDRKIDVVYRDLQLTDVPVNVLDVSLIKECLGWENKTKLNEGLVLAWSDKLRLEE